MHGFIPYFPSFPAEPFSNDRSTGWYCCVLAVVSSVALLRGGGAEDLRAEDSWLVFTSLGAGPQVFPGDGGDGRCLDHHICSPFPPPSFPFFFLPPLPFSLFPGQELNRYACHMFLTMTCHKSNCHGNNQSQRKL